MNPPLFERLLGDAFQSLAPKVRELHALQGAATWRGRASILRGRHPVARMCAAMAGLPPSLQDAATTVELIAEGDSERWRRDFGGHRLQSRLRERDGRLSERLGPIEFGFDLSTRDGELHWRTAAVRLLGIVPLPAPWFADVRCREREQAGRYEFLVEARLPWIGPLIRYEGWLERC